MEELEFIMTCVIAGASACGAVIELAEKNTYPAALWALACMAYVTLIIELA